MKWVVWLVHQLKPKQNFSGSRFFIFCSTAAVNWRRSFFECVVANVFQYENGIIFWFVTVENKSNAVLIIMIHAYKVPDFVELVEAVIFFKVECVWTYVILNFRIPFLFLLVDTKTTYVHFWICFVLTKPHHASSLHALHSTMTWKWILSCVFWKRCWALFNFFQSWTSIRKIFGICCNYRISIKFFHYQCFTNVGPSYV